MSMLKTIWKLTTEIRNRKAYNNTDKTKF